jgi:hypothetical protein
VSQAGFCHVIASFSMLFPLIIAATYPTRRHNQPGEDNRTDTVSDPSPPQERA